MDNSQFLAALRRDGAAFRNSVATVGLDTPIATCPGWEIRDLIWHLSEVYYFWASIVLERATSWEQVERIEQVADDRLLETYDAMFARLVDALSTTDPATGVWTWAASHDVEFVIRRMAQETAVHRWDADQAAGPPIAVEPELASDGIDEFLEHFLPNIAEGTEPVGGSVHIHCGDTAGEWTIQPTRDAYHVTREHAKADCALRGGASNLLLALWRRVGPDAIDIVGDTDVATRFLAAADLE